MQRFHPRCLLMPRRIRPLDAGLQLAMLAFGSEEAFLPIGAERVTLDFAPTRSVHLRASITSRSEAAFLPILRRDR